MSLGTARKTTGTIGGGLFLAALLCVGFGRGPQASAENASAPKFVRDIAPVLDKKGCSTAGCHGKFGGRGGFQVSLLTLSPQDDYDPIVRDARGRRINFVEPEKSLLLLKATGQINHGGGERFAVGSPEYTRIRDWIARGAPYNKERDPKITGIAITPKQFVMPKVGATVPLKVVARFSDGSARDVTGYANYESSDTATAKVSENGVVTGTRWGGGAVVVRYLGVVDAAFLTLPRADKAAYPKQTANNFIDAIVQANLKKMNVVPSRLTNDREFVRRVYLDVCGKLPSEAEQTAFVADTKTDKRVLLIDKLLDTPEYADVRTERLGDMLRVHPRNLGNNTAGERSTALWTEWIHDAVRDNLPYDQFVKQLLLARGSTFQNGAANFWRVERSPEDRMETTAQAFLGQRMACARCHKHPFDKWTTDDYWDFAAFMGKIGDRNGHLDGEAEIYNNPNGRVINGSVTGNKGKEAHPTFLGDKQALVLVSDKAAPVGAQTVPDANVMRVYAEWMVSPQNPYFAKATVNRLWSHYLGKGVVHPVDDMRATTPPSVPGLLDALAQDFVAHKYDTKRVIRLILNSRTYQTASDVNATNTLDDKFFSHFYPRPLPSYALLDSINQATGSNERFGDFPQETRAAQLTLPVNSYFLDTFGRSHREFLAELEAKNEPTLTQTLHILNSPYIDNKIKANTGTVANLLKDKNLTDDALIAALYEKTLCRPPSPKEAAFALGFLKQAPKRNEAAQDLLWALISAREFYFVS